MIRRPPGLGACPAKLVVTGTAVLVALALAFAQPARSGQPQSSGGSICTYAVTKQTRAVTALRGGIPVTVRCTGPATVLVGGSAWGRRVREYVAEHYDDGSPGEALMAPPRTVGAGPTVIRVKVRPWARGIFRRLAPFPVHMGLAVRDPDGRFRGFGNKTTRITR